jgi:aspartokinase
MGLIVQKYGGTSVRDPDHIRNVARRALDTVKALRAAFAEAGAAEPEPES